VLPAEARLYECARCGLLVVICRPCDHGNRYCKACGPLARREKQRKAGHRYQRSDVGRENHKARQEHLRDRRDRDVTHQSSAGISAERHCAPAPETTQATGAAKRNERAEPAPRDQPSLPAADRAAHGDSSEAAAEQGTLRCHFCDRPCRARKHMVARPQRRPGCPRLSRGPAP